MTYRPEFSNIDEYIAAAPAGVRRILEDIRQVVIDQVPGATETIGYQMPAFRQCKVFFYFAAFKHHIGVYPPVKGDRDLQKALLPYRGEKGNLKFPLGHPIPYDLIGRVAAALSREHGQ